MKGFSYGDAAEMMADAGHGFAQVWQPAGQVTAAGVGATPEVRAPAGQGLSHVSHPAGQVTAVCQLTGTAEVEAMGAAVMTAGVVTTAAEVQRPLFWGRAADVRERREMVRRMREKVVCDCCMVDVWWMCLCREQKLESWVDVVVFDGSDASKLLCL